MSTQVPYRPNSLLTVAAAADYLKVNDRTVRRKIAKGEIPAVRLTSTPRGALRIRAEELEAWLIGGGDK